MQTFAKLALAAGACALGLGAVLPVQAADMGYPEAQAAPGYPAPPPGYYAPPPAEQGYYPPPPPPAAYGYPPPPPVEYDTYVAPPYVVAPGPYYAAVLARLRASLCLWLWALARLSALVSARRLLIRHARPCAGHPRLTLLRNERRGWPGQC